MQNHSNRNAQRATDPGAAHVWQRITPLRRLLRKPAQVLAYLHLFHFAGYRPGSLRFSVQELAAEFGCETRTAIGWIEGLRSIGLLEIISNDRGLIDGYLHPPESVDEPRRIVADPQKELPLDRFETGESAQTPPGDFAQTPPVSSDPTNSQVVAPSTIRFPSQTPKQGDFVQSPPNHPMVTMEPSCSMGDGSRKSSLSMASMEGESALADLMRRRKTEADRIEGQAPRHVGGALVGAINRFADNKRPEAWKAELIGRIMDRKYPNLDRVVAARAADAVVFDGLPEKELSQILASVDRSVERGTARNPGAIFQSKMQKACAAAGIKWRDGKSRSEDRR